MFCICLKGVLRSWLTSSDVIRNAKLLYFMGWSNGSRGSVQKFRRVAFRKVKFVPATCFILHRIYPWMFCSKVKVFLYSCRSPFAWVAQNFYSHMNSEFFSEYMFWDSCGPALATITLSLEPPHQKHLQTTEEKIALQIWLALYEACCKAGWRHLVCFFGNPSH